MAIPLSSVETEGREEGTAAGHPARSAELRGEEKTNEPERDTTGRPGACLHTRSGRGRCDLIRPERTARDCQEPFAGIGPRIPVPLRDRNEPGDTERPLSTLLLTKLTWSEAHRCSSRARRRPRRSAMHTAKRQCRRESLPYGIDRKDAPAPAPFRMIPGLPFFDDPFPGARRSQAREIAKQRCDSRQLPP